LPRTPARIGYHNGCWQPADSIRLPIRDPAVTQAVTAVERLRAYGGRLFEVPRHLDRWQRTVEGLGIAGLPDRTTLAGLIEETITRNRRWIDAQDAFGVVLLASPGEGGQPTLVIDLDAIDAAAIRRRTESGSPLVITDVQQPSAACWPRSWKVRCRLHYYLADRQARQTHPEALGALVDADGSVTETSVANLLVVEGSTVISPPADQILPGVSLAVVRELAAEQAFSWREERLAPERVRTAAEVLLTGTSCGLWFAHSIDNGPSRQPGPVYRRLRQRFDQRAWRRGMER
jgi:branched-subunit amino acid aminotransferase/4-amino-4-deoxychorismate lyase